MWDTVEGQTGASAKCNAEVWWGETMVQDCSWCREDCVTRCCLEEGGQGFLEIVCFDVVDI
eukprot:9462652-Ditylum_brightwellii.AAC.1